MRVGFTGTQEGMSDQQKAMLKMQLRLFKRTSSVTEFHHGDCIGADSEAHDIARKLGIPIFIHPPANETKRAFCPDWFRMYPKLPYLERNHNIVDSVDMMIAAPLDEKKEVRRSGTWATVRYSRQRGRTLRILNR